jgi:large subunit ribosomal protein L17
MRHRKHTFKIGRTASHRRALLANLACSVISAGEVRTTVTRAKEARRVVDRMVTLGKRGSLHARRQAIALLRQPTVVHKLFSDIAPRYSDRDGGYTRIIKMNERVGDAAQLCILQLVTEPVTAKAKPAAEAESAPVATDTEAVTESAPAAESAEAAVAETDSEPETDEDTDSK